MKTIDQIKDEHAIALGYNCFKDLWMNPKQDMDYQHLQWCIERSMQEYAALQISAHCKDKEEWVKKALYDYKMLLDEYQHSDYSLYNNALNSLK